ncbi:TNF receptor-associated factor 3 [Fasciola gigantica]|uniref:TNF receptor-associated factor 3 n=1 Tax=Fasciola gigantica TaxID=46835 RepID=A0A504YPW7_FASGI|nr:TNF receptor-associated factor 3 [Fasciola gigantica]
MGKTEPKAEPDETPKLSTPESDLGKESKPKKEKKEKAKKTVKVKTEPKDGEGKHVDTSSPAESSAPVKEPSEKTAKKRERPNEGKAKKLKTKAENADMNEPKDTNNQELIDKTSVSSENVTRPVESTGSPLPGSIAATVSGSTPSSVNSVSSVGRDSSEIIFVDELDAVYRCILCGNPLRVPIRFEDCGHRCCSGCLPNILRPYRFGHVILPDAYFYSYHFIKPLLPISGTNDRKKPNLNLCSSWYISQQRFVEQHLNDDCPKRSKKCKFCDATLMAANELKHIGVCPKFPVSCPNGCKVHEIPRSQLTQHLTTECTKQDLPCPFAAHGCVFRGRKKKIEPHLTESSLEHLNLVNASLQQMSLLLEAQTKSLTDLKTVLTQQAKRVTGLERCFGAAFTWKIDNYTEKLNLAKSGKQTTIFSPAFYTHRCGYRMAMSVCLFGSGEARGKFLSVFVCLCRGDHDALLPWPFTNQLTFTLLDQHSEVTARKPVEYTIKPNPTTEQNMFLGRPTGDRNAGFGAPRFVKLETLKTSEYIVEDSRFASFTKFWKNFSPKVQCMSEFDVFI